MPCLRIIEKLNTLWVPNHTLRNHELAKYITQRTSAHTIKWKRTKNKIV
jgi:hypothetical protein